MWCKEWSTLHLVLVKFKYPFWLTRKHKMRKFLYGKKFFAGQNCNMRMMSFIYSSLAFWLFCLALWGVTPKRIGCAWHFSKRVGVRPPVANLRRHSMPSGSGARRGGINPCHRLHHKLGMKITGNSGFFHPNSFDLNLKFYLNSRINSSKFQI